MYLFVNDRAQYPAPAAAWKDLMVGVRARRELRQAKVARVNFPRIKIKQKQGAGRPGGQVRGKRARKNARAARGGGARPGTFQK